MSSLRACGVGRHKVSCMLRMFCEFYCLCVLIPKIELAHSSESLFQFTNIVATYTRGTQPVYTHREPEASKMWYWNLKGEATGSHSVELALEELRICRNTVYLMNGFRSNNIGNVRIT